MADLDFPFRIGPTGRTASTDDDDHVRDLIEQVLFTAPGERVNRPEFGCGLRQLVFAAGGGPVATATERQVQGALDRWLGDLIRVESLEATAREERLEIEITYVRRDTGRRERAEFATSAGVSEL